jgi:hypothetical protein
VPWTACTQRGLRLRSAAAAAAAAVHQVRECKRAQLLHGLHVHQVFCDVLKLQLFVQCFFGTE